jgi:hypothetical protein
MQNVIIILPAIFPPQVIGILTDIINSMPPLTLLLFVNTLIVLERQLQKLYYFKSDAMLG